MPAVAATLLASYQREKSQSESHRIKNTHSVILTHPGLSHARQTWRELGETIGDGYRDLLFV